MARLIPEGGHDRAAALAAVEELTRYRKELAARGVRFTSREILAMRDEDAGGLATIRVTILVLDASLAPAAVLPEPNASDAQAILARVIAALPIVADMEISARVARSHRTRPAPPTVAI
jgi:hypothetical protein